MIQAENITDRSDADFNRWAEAMGLARKLDVSRMNDDDRKSFEESKDVILEALHRGALIVNEAGEFVFTPQVGENRTPITFPEPDGAALMAMDRAKADQGVTRTFIVLAQVTGQNSARFAAMKNRDNLVCRTILSLFLGK